MACRVAATEVEVLTQEVVAAPGVTELTIETWEAFMSNAGEHHVLVSLLTRVDVSATQSAGPTAHVFGCALIDARWISTPTGAAPAS
jgi:transketolase N-terminal domain/subunit